MVYKTVNCYLIFEHILLPWDLKTISDSKTLLNYPFKGLEALGVLDAFLCYLSIILKCSDTKLDLTKT